MKKSEKPRPPAWANKLLIWSCASHLREEIEGDLQEEFDYQVIKVGARRAQLDYIRNVLGFIRPSSMKRKRSKSSSIFPAMNMFQHNATVAFRNLNRHKAFSAINILGLALGMGCCLMIFLWIEDERSVDNFHANGESLHSVYQRYYFSGAYAGANYGTSDQLASELIKAFPDIKYAVPYATGYELPWGHPETFQVGEKIHKLEGSRAGADFFMMFSYELIAGTPEHALSDISSLAISRKMAELFFESPEDAIGKSIRFENRKDLMISAVFEDLPAQSSYKFDYVLNWEAYQANVNDLRASWNTSTFVQLEPTANAMEVESKLREFLNKFLKDRPENKVELGLQRFGDAYLYSDFNNNGRPEGGRIVYVRLFGGIALFILIIACINFMNLATARAVKRSREVGIRKVVGSSRFNLVIQFFGESMLLAFFSLILSVALVQLLLPLFNDLTSKQITSPLFVPMYWIAFGGLTIITGFVAGSYPALFLSSLKPVRVLKGVVRFGESTVWFRKGLVVFQFILSIILLISTLVVSRQTHFLQTTDLGYDRENVIYLRLEGELINKYLVFKEEASKMPGIKFVDRSSETPHAMKFMTDAINWEGKEEGTNLDFSPTSVGYDFIKLMSLELVQGRDFSRDIASDTAAFLVNETALRQMGVKDPIGKWISAWNKKGHIIGVLKDYHTRPLHMAIEPLIVDVKEGLDFGTGLIRTEAGKTKEALASLEKVCKTLNPNYAFNYQFLDQEYDKLYHNEQIVTKLTNVFAFLAIIISCLGLLGLAMFSAEQRTKEIGIRKVLGATVSSIVSLLSKDFLKLVVISFVIASPIAGFFMNKWLEGFAFKINLSWWIFAIAGGSALFVALLTISVQAINSALASPVKSLKTE